MANTANLNLFKPTRDDYINVERDIAQNMQKIDDAFGRAVGTSELGIVVTGNTANIDITATQYVIVRGSTIENIDDGLYTSNSDIPAGQAIVDTDLTVCPKGGYNQLHMAMFPDYANMESTDYFSNSIRRPNNISEFTVPKTGFWRIKIMTYDGVECSIRVNGNMVLRDQRQSSVWCNVDALLPLYKGDLVEMSCALDMPNRIYYFPLRNP